MICSGLKGCAVAHVRIQDAHHVEMGEVHYHGSSSPVEHGHAPVASCQATVMMIPAPSRVLMALLSAALMPLSVLDSWAQLLILGTLI